MMGHDHEHGDSEGRRSSTHHLAKSAKTFFDHGKAHAKEYTGFSITDGSRVHCGDSFNSGENFVYNAAPEPKLESLEEKNKHLLDTLRDATPPVIDPEEDRSGLTYNREDRTAKTCTWIRDDETYQSWLQDRMQFLWITGKPGTGKTIFSLFLTEELEFATQSKDDEHVIYCFCTYRDGNRNNAVYVLRTLIWQVLRKRTELCRHLSTFFDTSEHTQQSLSSRDTLWRILSNVLQDPRNGKVFCVLDGLDECDDDSPAWLARKFGDFYSKNEVRKRSLNVVLLSRPDILELATHASPAQIDLGEENEDKVRADLEKYVSDRIQKLPCLERAEAGFQDRIRKELLDGAQGTFLWVSSVMTDLKKERTPTGVLQRLRSFPNELTGIFNRILRRIEPDRREAVASIFRWVTLAVEPVSFEELAAATNIKDADTIDRARVIRDHVTMCDNFLQNRNGVVTFMHKSARDYLLQEGAIVDEDLKIFCIEPEEGHLGMAMKCLESIGESHLQNQALMLRDDKRWKNPPLLTYAVLHWPVHARCAGERGLELFKSPSFAIHKKRKLAENWWQSYISRGKGEEWEQGKALSPFHVACRFGIEVWVRALIEGCKTERKPEAAVRQIVNDPDTSGVSPLTWAIIGKHEGVARLLLNNGANASEFTALFPKSSWYWGYSRGVKSYVREMTDYDSIWTGKHTALYRAAWQGNVEIVKLLLEHKADMNARGFVDVTAFHGAALGGNAEIMRQLLMTGDEKTVNAPMKWTGYTPLTYAIFQGHHEVAALLLDSCADVHHRMSFDANTCLHEVSQLRAEQTEMARFLIGRGIDIEATNRKGKTPLHLAAGYGNLATAELLLDHEANVNAKAISLSTPLIYAVRFSRNKTIELLLSRGADVNAANRMGESALDIATCRSGGTMSETVKILRRAGAVLCHPCRRGRTFPNFFNPPTESELAELAEKGDGDNDKKQSDYSRGWYCNACGLEKEPLSVHYHCNICDHDQYDLCETCVAEGKRCPGESDGHSLIKRNVVDGNTVELDDRVEPSKQGQSETRGTIGGHKSSDSPAVEETADNPLALIISESQRAVEDEQKPSVKRSSDHQDKSEKAD